MRLLLVEDDFQLSAVIAEALEDFGYVVDIAHDGLEGLNLATEEEYGVILVDFMLPQLDGIELCQRLRATGSTIPIIILTARDTSTDKVLGLDAGADDYLVKPIDLPELLARIRAVLRRGQSSPTTLLSWGNLNLHPNNRDVTYANKALSLTRTEFSLLELFLRNGPKVLTRQSILNQLWDSDDPPGEETVKTHLKGLRYKLKKAGAPSDFIETIWGVGYRLKDA